MARKLRERPEARTGTHPAGDALSEALESAGPLLLVSVRNAEEAAEALRGGASILDVKEPAMGALGRAPPPVQREVERVAREHGSCRLVTAALGELAKSSDLDELELPDGIGLFKLGLSGCQGRRGWEESLSRLASRLEGQSASLVAVAYADSTTAGAPDPRRVLRFAIERQLPFFLLDTFRKGCGGLRAHLDDRAISSLVIEARENGVRVALAGSLSAEDVEEVVELGPDVIAVRGAACAGGRRDRAVEHGRVAALVRAISSRTRHPASRASCAPGSQAPRRA